MDAPGMQNEAMPTKLLIAVSLLLASPAMARAAEDIQVLKHRQWVCDELDMIELADTPAAKVNQKIVAKMARPDAYRCFGVGGTAHVINVVRKKNPRGNAYVCFDFAATSIGPQWGPHCALPHAVASLGASLSS